MAIVGSRTPADPTHDGPDTAAKHRRGPRTARRFLRRCAPVLLAAGGYFAAVLWQSWPLPLHPGSALIDPAAGQGGLGAWNRIDLDLTVWILAWVAHALRAKPFALFEANIFHPAPDTLTASEHMLGLQPIAGPVFWASGNAVLTYNLTALAVVWLTALCSFVAVRSWTRNAAVAFFAGAAFAFAPRVSGGFVRIHSSAVSLFPLVTLLAWRAACRPRRSTLVALALATAVQVAAGVYVAFELIAWLGALAPALVWKARRSGHRGLAAPLGLLVPRAAPLMLPYLRVRRFGGFPDFQRRSHPSWGPRPLPRCSAGSRRSGPGRSPASRSSASSARAVRRRLLRGAILAADSSGSCSPAAPVAGALPPRDGHRPRVLDDPWSQRSSSLPLLSLALLASFGAADLLRRLVIGPAIRRGRPLPSSRPSSWCWSPATGEAREVPAPGAWDAYRWLATREYGALVELPVFRSPLEPGPLLATGRYMIGSTIHWLPLVNAYSGHPPQSARLLATLADRLPDPQAFADFCSLVRLRWIVVHLDQLPTTRARWEGDATGLPIRAAARFGDDVVFEVTVPCGAYEDRLRAEMRGERGDRTVGDVGLAALPAHSLHGRVEVAAPPEMVAGLLRSIDVDVTNESPSPWPGLTSREEGRVALQVRWHSPGEEVRQGDGSRSRATSPRGDSALDRRRDSSAGGALRARDRPRAGRPRLVRRSRRRRRDPGAGRDAPDRAASGLRDSGRRSSTGSVAR
jgi:hypothetical protein